MIRSYKYIDTVHSKLNDYVMAFFSRIENDTGGFRDELFETEFLPIVKHHRIILKRALRIIYEYVSELSATDRHSFCQRIIESNQIERICCGEYKPEAFNGELSEIDGVLKKLFLDLYNQVLVGPAFRESTNTTLRDHFNQFCDENKDITICPFCGIGELKKSHDEFRDQYDHYLPKSLYPFSSINFYNLVLCCRDCNCLEVKGDKDIIAVSTGKLFFPYDVNHKEIILTVNVKHDNAKIEQIEWKLIFSCTDGKCDEIKSWKSIYKIESRYQGLIKGRIEKWYKHYYQEIKYSAAHHRDISEAKKDYMRFLERDKSLDLAFIRKPALDGLLSGSNIVQAEIEALEYV